MFCFLFFPHICTNFEGAVFVQCGWYMVFTNLPLIITVILMCKKRPFWYTNFQKILITSPVHSLCPPPPPPPPFKNPGYASGSCISEYLQAYSHIYVHSILIRHPMGTLTHQQYRKWINSIHARPILLGVKKKWPCRQ